MRKSKKIRILCLLLLCVILIFFGSLTLKILDDYAQCSTYEPIYEILRSIKHLNHIELNDSLLKTKEILSFGFNETRNQFVNFFEVGDVSDYSQLDSYYIYIDSHSYDELTSDLPFSGFNEVKGYLVYNGKKIQDVKLRFRGDNRWHWYFTQKSWRVKTDKDELVNGSRKLNLTNPIEKSFMMDYLSYKVGDKMKLLTYEAEPVRVFLNNRYMGISVSLSQTDEYFLRNNNKLPSEIYSGDLVRAENEVGYNVAHLWKLDGINAWEKMSNNNSILEDDFSRIENLISYVEENRTEPFKYDVEKMVDIDKYLKWRACLVILSSYHSDNIHNNRFYFDPSNGKLEPILWDTDGLLFGARNIAFNFIINDLDRCILKNPEYVDIMNNYIWQAITGDVSEEIMLSTIEDTYLSMKNDVYSDIYKDYLQPGYDMNRNYTNAEFDSSVIEIKNFITDRYAIFDQKFANTTISCMNNIVNDNLLLSYRINGYSGASLDYITLSTQLDEKQLRIYRDINFNCVIDSEDELVKTKIEGSKVYFVDEKIYPAKKYLDNNPQLEYKWAISVEDYLCDYNYILDTSKESEAKVEVLEVSATSSVTGQPIAIDIADKHVRLDGEFFSTHPWEIQDGILVEDVVFEAGEHIIEEDIIVNKLSSLTISEGAVLKLKEGISIYAFGQVDINGTEQNPVIIEPYEKNKPWGVFAIQGHYNPDLVHNIDHAVIKGGGVPQTFENAMYTGMLSAYNSNIVMTNTSIISNRVGDDGFNSKQGNVEIDHCYFYDAYSDAVDLDYATGSITNSYFESNGNDAIDLMTTSVEIENNYIFDSGDKGISVGERSHPKISNNVITSCNIGIEIKDLSDPQIRNVVLYSNNKAINVYHKNDKYESGGRGDIFNSIIANSFISSVTVDKDSKLNISDSVFDTQVHDTKDLDLKNCNVIDIKKGDLTIENAGLNKPIEMWWE